MITCSINDDAIIAELYSDVSGSMNQALKSNSTFDAMDYMKNLFKDFSEQSSPEVAAKFLQSIPRIIIDVKNNFFEQLKLKEGLRLDALDDLNTEFKNPDTGVASIINTLSDISELQEKKDIIENEQKNEISLDQNPSIEPPVVRLPERFSTLSAYGGTSQAYVKLDPNKKEKNPFLSIEDLNQELTYMVKTFDRIKEIQNTTNPLNGIVYQGKRLVFKAITLSAYATPQNLKYLDKSTQSEIDKSNAIVDRNLKVSEDIKQANQRVILLISDDKGNTLYFDEEGNITTAELGKPVYQFMRTIREKNGEYSATNMYNTEDLLISVEAFVENTYNPEIDGTKEEYTKLVREQRNKDLEELYTIQNEILNGETKILPITNVTNGVPTNLSATKIYLNDLINLPSFKDKVSEILKSIYTIPFDQKNFKSGSAFIKINGNDFFINRPLITDDLALEIAEVLTNKNIKNEDKKEYTNQFFEGFDLGRTSKQYDLFYSKDGKSIYFNLYDGFGKDAKKLDVKIKLDQEALKKAGDEVINKYKEYIVEYLTQKGLKKNSNRTQIIFKNTALASGVYMRLNTERTGFNRNADYFDFIKGLKSDIELTNADPGFYNYVVNFTTDNSSFGKEILKEQDPFDEDFAPPKPTVYEEEAYRIVNTATSDAYKSTIDQANPYDSFLITKYFIEEITNNYSKNQTREFAEDIFKLLSEGYNSVLNQNQKDLILKEINKTKFSQKTASEKTNPPIEEQISEGIASKNNSPENNTPVNDIFKEEKISEKNKKYFERSGIKPEFISPLKVRQAKSWWNSKEMEPMRKLIEFGHMANIVNSDVYARFIVAGATLADTSIMGRLEVNKKMGSIYQNLTIYHEAWHVFSQLFLTKQQKLDLYNELKNYKDAKGNTPYSKMSFRELEEMLAEDFRNYVKTGKAKQAAPKRNTLFRKIVEFLKQLFGKVLKKFKKQDTVINSLNSPMAQRLFNELYIGDFNKYSPSIDNQMFTQLDRGPRQVEYPSQDALSPGDGLLISNSIDNFFAEKINELQEESKSVGVSLSALMNPKYKSYLYNDAREKFEEILRQEEAKLKTLEGVKDFNELKTLEEIESNAIAVMKASDGKNKYFFLTSQVRDFNNLLPSTKRGERVRGEDYKDSVRIVGDFYKHGTIKKNGRNIDIVLVTRSQDAQTQFDNYKKAKAKVFTELIKQPVLDKVEIDQDQETIRDNVRILQTTLKNWGDEKSGIIKYHMENTAYEVSRKKYAVEDDSVIQNKDQELDENGELVDEEENKGGLEQNNEKTGKQSLQQTMSKQTIFVLKTLLKVDSEGNFVKDRFGIIERAEFSKTFAIVAKTIGGIRDRNEAYTRLKEESEKFPELKQLFKYKFPDPNKSGAEVNTFEFDLARGFFQDFAKPQIDYQQLYAYYREDDKELDFIVKKSDLAVDNVVTKWINTFETLKKSKYVNVSRDNIRSLNLSEVVKDFKDSKSDTLNLNKQIQFAKILGIELQDNDNIKKELDKPTSVSYYGLAYIYDILKKVNQLDILESNGETITEEQKLLLNNFKKNPLKVLSVGFSESVLDKSKKGKVSELTQLKRLAELQIMYGYDSSSTAIIRSNQTVGYKEVNWSSLHAAAYALNQVQYMHQLWTDPRYNSMSHLNPEINTHVRHLKIMSTLFNFENKGEKKKNKSLEVFAQDGFAFTDYFGNNSGNVTTDLDPLSKFIFEFHSFSLAGVAELPRTSDKKFSYGVKINGGIDQARLGFDASESDKNLYINTNKFLTEEGEQIARVGYLYGYIQGEYDRIKKFRGPDKDKYLRIKGYNNRVIENGKELYSGETFVAFKGMLSQNTKNKLYELADQQSDIDILSYVKEVDKELGTMIKNDIKKYFDEILSDIKSLYFNNIPYISKSLFEKVGIKREDLSGDALEQFQKDNKLVNALLKSYMFNDFIHKYETSIILFGDHAQWDHGKQDWSKRIPGLTSDGIGFMFDEQTQSFINDVFNKETYASKLTEKEGINYDNFVFSEKLNSAVIEDPVRESIYIKEYQKLWEKDYLKRFSPEVAKEKAAADAELYKKMKESDGMAYVTLDAYRTLKKTGRGWSLAEEALYQKIINNETITSKDIDQFYSIYKLHYFGTIENDVLPVRGMYKFSVIPLIPGVNAVAGSELEKLHKLMLKQNIQLVTFGSGSKGAYLTSDGKTDNVFSDKEMKFVNTEVNDEGENIFKFTNNPIYLANLKEVTVMNDSYKGELQIATQTRAIIIDNLFEDGELKNSNNKAVVDEYSNTIKEYSKLLKEDLLNGLGIELIDGRVIGDFTKFVEIIRSELTERDTPQHLIKLINTDNDGKLAMDLSLHPESDSIEKLLVSLIQRGVVKQKTKGEPLVQSPATFTNGIWDSPYIGLTELKEIQKLLGTNTLPFYLINGETRSEEMKVAIALQGDFRNLLNAKDLDGNKIETIERLNQLIKNPEWFAKNKKSLTLFGPRIPNDAHNTIEAATVWHFLPESFGNTIITPTEIVAKAGSDFDGDKLFMSMPNIDSEGNYIDKGVENFYKVLEETKELEKKNKLPEGRLTSRQLINLQKKYLQNKYLQASVEILMLPENAVTLIKPNGTYLMDRYEENVTANRTGYDKFKNVDNRPSDVNTKGEKIPSPTSHFTIGYNLYVHEANLSLEPSLGILAKLTKSIPLYKAAGAKMPARYRISDTLKVPLKVRFDVNTTVNSNNEEVVSVGAENNVAGENISDTTSHSLQGVLDRAKATFPFELKLVPEAMTVYGYLTRAGMDQEDIVYLLNQPLVAKYLNMQKMNNSSINNALFGSKKDFEIKNEIILDVLNSQLNEDQIKKLIADVSNDKLSATLKSLPEDLKITVTIGKNIENTTVKDLRNSLNTKKINPNLISGIRSADEESTKIYNRILGANWLSHKENLYFLIEKLAKVNLTNKDKITKSDLYSVLNIQDASSSKALLIFLHYLELENQYSRMSDFEQAFSPDTSKLTTVQEAKDRKNVLKTFEKDEEIDQDFVKYMTKQSVISSLMFDDLTIDLVTPLFEIKLNEKITSFLKRGIDNTRAEIILKYGRGADGRANFTRAFGNNLINYIYQNYQTNFYDESGKLSNLPQSTDKKTIEINNDINTPVLVQEDKIIVNTRLIEFDYATKNYLENRNPETSYEGRGYDTFKLGQDPFISLRSFYRYNIERAILESKNSIDTLSNDDYFISLVAKNDGNAENAYKQYISERALLNSYNPMYIMGKTKYSYRDNILELLNSLENYPALFEKFTILSQISPQRNRDGYKIIRLNNRNDIKGALAQEYFNQIRQLGDYSIQKLDNPKNDPLIASKDKRISDLFNVFSLMMYYQHGIGKTTTGFVKGLDSTQYKSLMQDITPAFMSNYIETNEKFDNLYVSDLVLATIFNKTLEASNFNIFASPRNIYYNSDMEQIATQVDIELQKAGEEEFDINEGKQSIPEEFKRGDRLILDEDVKLYNSVLIKNNGVKPKRWTTPNTKFSEFYNGRQQGMPNSTAWLLNDNNLYDMVEIGADSDMAGTVYYENVDLETGYQMFKEGEGPTQPSVRKTYSGKVTSLQPNQIFVFGSNPEGRHGAGAAKYAKDNFGAVYGQGEGLQGQSYALPTKDLRIKTNNSLRSISAEDITKNIKKLYEVARQNPAKEFLVSDYSESNLNGYTGQEMADMFSAAGPIPSNIVFNENFDKLITTQPSTNLPGSDTKINIYAGTGENAELSNFAIRPFKGGVIVTTYKTVEGAFQAAKLRYTAMTLAERLPFINALAEATGAEAKKIGRQIQGLDTKAWDANSSAIMKNILKESFEQNPDALAKLLATGNATLTHTQDKTKWGKEFPKLLMEVREELRGTQKPTETPTAVPVVDKVADIEKVGINNLLVSGIVTNPTTIEKGKQYLLVTYTGYTGNASAFEIVTATGNKKEESQVSSGSGVSKNLVDTFINSKGQEVTTGGLNKKIVELPTININDKKQVLTFLLNQAKNKKLLSAPKGSKLGLQEITEDKTKVKLHFLNSDFTKGETWINYNASNRDYEKLATDFLIAKYDAELAALKEQQAPTTQPNQPVGKVKEGVSELFESNPELAAIGTPEQYSQYLNTVFPDSKVKDIVYHGTDATFDKFAPTKPKFDTLNSIEGVYNFTTNKEFSKRYGKNILSILLNINKPIQEKTSGEFLDDMDRPLSEALYKIGKQTSKNILAPKYDETLKDTDAVINRIEGDNYALPIQTVISVFEPEQIHILGSKQDIEGFKNFVSTQSTQPTGPVRDGGSESSINTDMEEYQKLVEASNGVQPKTFTVGTRTWNLNKFGNYDWSDPTTNQIYMRNVDMETGKSVPEPLREEPVNPKLIEANLNWINTNKKLLDLDNKLAFLGYDINDVIDKLVSAKTMGDYYDVQEIFNKLC